MGIVVIGDVFIDIKGYSLSPYIPQGRNAGTVIQIHGGVARNVAENIANIELKPTFMRETWWHPSQRDRTTSPSSRS